MPRSEDGSGMSTMGAAINLAKLCLGAGILALPIAIARGGLLFGPIAMAGIAIWNSVSCALLIECKNRACCPAPSAVHCNSTYSLISFVGLGRWGMIFTDFCIVVTLLGVCIAYQITFADLLVGEWAVAKLFSRSMLTVVIALLAFPLCCVGDMGKLSVFSLAGLVCLILGVITILLNGAWQFGPMAWEDPLYASNSDMQLQLMPTNRKWAASLIGIATFCFGICSLVLPVEESTENKKEFHLAVRWCLCFVWVLYVLVGDGGALLYIHHPEGIHDNILANLPSTSIATLLVRLSMASVCVLTLPLTFVPAAELLENMLARSLFSSQDLPRGKYEPIPDYAIDEEKEEEENRLNAGHRVHLPIPKNFVVVHRLALTALCTLTAACMPSFATVISVIGSCTVAILSFVLPPLLHLCIVAMPHLQESSDREAKIRCFVDGLLLFFGVILSSLATFTIMSG